MNKRIFLGVFTVVLVLCLPVLLFADGRNLRVHFIDVGYGDAILVEFPRGEFILVDAGDAQYAEYLEEYLLAQDIKEIKFAILTHPHKNHFGGFFSVTGRWPIEQFYINGDAKNAEEGYDGLEKMLQDKNIPVSILRKEDEFFLDEAGLYLKVLHPQRLTGSGNGNAIVLQLVYQETSFLLTSDIQREQQKQLFVDYPEIVSASCIQIPHHGGEIDDRFAKAFGNDSIFIVSTGENIYQKPFEHELSKLKGKVLRTDLEGDIVVQSDGHSVRVIYE